MNVVILAMQYCAAASVHGMLDILTTANYCAIKAAGDREAALFRLDIVTPDDQPVQAYSGATLIPTARMAEVSPDILIVASAVEAFAARIAEAGIPGMNQSMYDWMRQLHQEGCIMASACTGSFMLAQAGLLEGKTVTTHWRAAATFSKRFPDIRLRPQEMLIDAGDVITAGGATAFMELSFHLIERFGGQTLASACSKLHVFEGRRENQSPYIMFQGYRSHKDERIKKAQQWMEEKFTGEFSMDDVAAVAGLGNRTFKRRFKEATGETPISYLQKVRIEASKQLLETTSKTFNEIIWSVGYEDVSSFRRLFKRETGCTMEQYRQRFAYTLPTPFGEPGSIERKVSHV